MFNWHITFLISQWPSGWPPGVLLHSPTIENAEAVLLVANALKIIDLFEAPQFKATQTVKTILSLAPEFTDVFIPW